MGGVRRKSGDRPVCAPFGRCAWVSPRFSLGQDKSAKVRFDFSPCGEMMRSAGLPLTTGHTGHLWEPAIGQYYAPFRYYKPQTARWNVRDPLALAAGLNMYAYVAGNPITSRDLLGLTDTPRRELPKTKQYCNPSPKTGEPDGQEPKRQTISGPHRLHRNLT